MTTETRGITPHLVVDDAAAAVDYYKMTLGATEIFRMPAEDGRRVLHAELAINGARVFLRDDFPEFCPAGGVGNVRPPKAIDGTSVTFHLDVASCDAAVVRAVAAGATVVMPPEDAFWGARYAQILDPFGHSWSFAHPLPGAAG